MNHGLRRKGNPMAVDLEESMLVRVQLENFSIDEELDRVRSRSRRIGGIAIFLGTARDRSKGRDVSSMSFDHYEGMAQKKLKEIREQALRDLTLLRPWCCIAMGQLKLVRILC